MILIFKKKITHDSMLINLFGIESPGLTSSIQICKYIYKVLQSETNL